MINALSTENYTVSIPAIYSGKVHAMSDYEMLMFILTMIGLLIAVSKQTQK